MSALFLSIITFLFVALPFGYFLTELGYETSEFYQEIAKNKGIIAFNPLNGNNPIDFVKNYTNNIGADAVIITASNKTNEIM